MTSARRLVVLVTTLTREDGVHLSSACQRVLRGAAVLATALTAACGSRTTPSRSEAERLIAEYPAFAHPRSVRLPSRIVIPSGFSSPLTRRNIDPEDLGSVDWVTQALEQRGAVRLTDYPRVAPGTVEEYDHFIYVAPTAEALATGDFIDDEDPPTVAPFLRISKTPGWRVALARREVVRTTKIVDHSEATETVPFGSAHVHFEFRWRPTSTGDTFDQGRDDFLTLRRAAFTAARRLDIDSRVPIAATATFRRDTAGKWRVVQIDCGRRCNAFDPDAP